MAPLPKKVPVARDLSRALSIAFDHENERHGYINALLIICEVLRDGTPEHAFKLAKLASALLDLDTGAVHPLLRPADIENRPPLDSGMWRRRTYVALGILSLTTYGLSRDEAASEAERAVKTLHVLAGDTKPRNAALSWHDELAKGRNKNFEAAHTFRVGRDLIGKAMAYAARDSAALKRLAAKWFYLADLAA